MGAHTLLRFALDAPRARGRARGRSRPRSTPSGRRPGAGSRAGTRSPTGCASGGVEGFVEAYGEPARARAWRDTVAQGPAPAAVARTSTPTRVADALHAVPRSRPFEALDELGAIDAPTVVVASRDEADPGHPLRASASATPSAIPGARLVVRGAGQLAARLAGRPALEGDRRASRSRRRGVSEPAGYSGTPLPRSSGSSRARAWRVLSAAAASPARSGELPDGVTVRDAAARAAGRDRVLHDAAAALERRIPSCARARAGGAAVDRLAEARVGRGDRHDRGRRARVALAHRLVDNKVAAIDATWSGLQLVIRVADRA